MKRRERQLLNNFADNQPKNKGLLASLKNAMGSVGYVNGNPLSKTEIALQVTKNYFADGVSIAPTALPASLQTPIPAFIFGLTDYYSGFAKGLHTIKPVPTWQCINGLGEKLGAELIDQNDFTGWTSAGWWNLFGADWSQQVDINGIFFLRCNGAGVNGALIKNNILIPGHKYRVSFSVLNAPYSLVNYFQGFGDSFYLNHLDNWINQSYINIEYDFIAQTGFHQLRGVSSNLAMDVYNLSLKEVTGYADFKGEPSIGIFGITKNIVYSTTAARGDLVITYSANPYPSGVTYTCEVIVHCNNVAYGTFLNSFVSDLITIDTLRYSVPIASITQFINPLIFIYQSIFGKYDDNSIDPRNYITNTDFQQQICDLPLSLPIDKNIILSIPMNFDCNSFSMLLFVEKVEPLTNIPNQLKY